MNSFVVMRKREKVRHGGRSFSGQPAYLLCGSVPLRELQYDADGNLRDDGDFHYSYDAEKRLVSARHSSLTNGALRVLNSYDHKHRRTRKTVQRFNIPSVAPPMPARRPPTTASSATFSTGATTPPATLRPPI